MDVLNNVALLDLRPEEALLRTNFAVQIRFQQREMLGYLQRIHAD